MENNASQSNYDTQEQVKRQSKVNRSYAGAFVAFLLLLTTLFTVYYYELLPFEEYFAWKPIHKENNVEDPLVIGDEEIPETLVKLAPIEKALSARGLYVTMDVFGTPSIFAKVITFVRQNPGLNCLVVDVKDNDGRIPQKAPDIVSKPAPYDHFAGLVNVLEQEDFYLIARIVAFQDPYLATKEPKHAIRNADGSLWRDRDGRLWLNPYDKANWEFVRDVSLWALDMGFHEIQLDYVRFPDSAQGLEATGVLMPGSENYESRGDAISEFLEYMGQAFEGKGYLSADVFGFVTIAQDDMGIGQKLEQLADSVDFICPMVYPSHYYNAGIYGFQVPEQHPYEVVYNAINEALTRTEGLKSKIRPWLQDFSMRVQYGSEEVQAQINAVFEHEIHTYMLWNPSNRYTESVDYLPKDRLL